MILVVLAHAKVVGGSHVVAMQQIKNISDGLAVQKCICVVYSVYSVYYRVMFMYFLGCSGLSCP